jgi:long-chain acyl-CoA synthetase
VHPMILLTGATGSLGTHVARRLLAPQRGTLLALVRAPSDAAAADRLARAWWDWPDLTDSVGQHVHAIAGDVSAPQLGLGREAFQQLAGRVTHVIHAAAEVRLDTPSAALRRTNVEGTANVLELARAAHADHGLVRLCHVSTAYVAGRRTGTVLERDLSDAFGFRNAYEASKYEGERTVRDAMPGLPATVVRPGMIVGDSRTGAIKTFNTLYYPLRLYLMGALRVLPVRPTARVNMVPIDVVADAVAALAFDPAAEGETFHLTCPTASQATVAELLRLVREWSARRLGLRLPRLAFVPLPSAAVGRALAGSLNGRSRGLGALARLLPYVEHRASFDRSGADRLLGRLDLDWRVFLPPLLEYAVAAGFMHRSERTVHEQMLFRMERPSRPVAFHDVVAGRVRTRAAGDVRADIEAAASALRALGVGRGDRVALTGRNSTRYLTIDAAIGLVGAVSVPLYYTSPAAEIASLTTASQARLLFVGEPKLLAEADRLPAEVPVISLCREPVTVPDGVMPWDAFMALEAAPAEGRPRLDDLATIRFTSGTTGRPQGVTFDHQQLRWMAERMGSLLPWRTRWSPHRYLSFLPLNHVVEGILTNYAGYYLPAPVEFYFLEDFRALEATLPRVRPTMFFCVPRFYEKAWTALQRNRVGRWYCAAQPGLARRLARPIVRRMFLRRVGLDRCGQLVVGSAPVDEGLLRAYRELGIELHDAYGFTEAPLVTFNRVGANRLGTVGQPLPQTQLRFSDDGEVLVQGPQVTRGYVGTDDQPFQGGWLRTGDLGRLTTDGYLVIEGRKKELIATSYGKKVHPAKVERALVDIPGVVEAMLVGEQRPYCVALLWLDGAGADLDAIDRAIRAANERLSRPETVRRWALLPYDLTVAGGDLTANLKLRRTQVAARYGPAIDALYQGAPVPGALHVGRSEAASDTVRAA